MSHKVGVRPVERAQRPRQREIAARNEELLDKLIGRREQDADTGADECVPECAREVALADAGATEQEHVVGALDEAATRELAHLDQHGPWDAAGIEGVEGLGGRQARGATQSLDPPLATRVSFNLKDLSQGDERLRAVRGDEALGHLVGGTGQLEQGEQCRNPLAELQRVVGHAAPAIVIRSS